jgi:hypothetical protein
MVEMVIRLRPRSRVKERECASERERQPQSEAYRDARGRVCRTGERRRAAPRPTGLLEPDCPAQSARLMAEPCPLSARVLMKLQ